MKIKLTVVGVLIFIILLVCSLTFEDAVADPYIGLGYTVANSTLPTGEISYRWQEKWAVSASVIGEGDTKKGEQGHVSIVSASRLVRPGWRLGSSDFFMRIGLAYVDDSPLVGTGNYRLGAGLDFGVWEIEYGHYSSAGINEINRGYDLFSLKVKL